MKSGAPLTTAQTLAAPYLTAANNHSLTVTSITYGGQIGGSYALLDWLSLGAAFRFTYGTQELELTIPTSKVSYDASAVGFSGVFGVHAKPIEGLDVAGQFAWRSKMNYAIDSLEGETTAVQFGITKDKEFRTDLAPVLNLGVGYRVIDPLYVSTSFNFYFNSLAKMNSVLSTEDNEFDPSFEIALGADYDINEKITASLGIAYGNQGVTEKANSTFNPVLDSFQVGAGVEVHPIEPLTITGGATWVKYFEEDYSVGGINTKLSKPLLLMFSLGATYRFPL